MIEKTVFSSPMGLIEICLEDTIVVSIQWIDNKPISEEISAQAMNVRQEINEFLAGFRTNFTFMLHYDGSAFTKRVMKEIYQIPYGQVVSYSDLARMAGKPNAIRAVGSVCRKNPLPLVIPCHRVIHKNGDLGNYAGGRLRKQQLLEMERRSQ